MHTQQFKPCEHVQLRQVLRAMNALEGLATQLPDVPASVFTNALLNSAIERLLRERGFDHTASAMHRLATLIEARIVPGGQGLSLNRTDA